MMPLTFEHKWLKDRQDERVPKQIEQAEGIENEAGRKLKY